MGMAPIPKGAYIMSVQLPEPDYYTIEEVKDRWSVSVDFLLRLATENKIEICARLQTPLKTIVLDRCDNTLLTYERAVELGLLHAPESEDGKIERKLWDSTWYMMAGTTFKLSRVEALHLLDGGKEVVPDHLIPRSLTGHDDLPEWVDDLIFTGFSGFERATFLGIFSWKRDVDNGMLLPRVTKDDLVILSEEIRRIETLHLAAEQAVAKDVLGGKAVTSRRILLSVINALCIKAGIDPKGRSATSEIMTLLDLQGTPASEHTIRDAMKEIPEAVKVRKTANSK